RFRPEELDDFDNQRPVACRIADLLIPLLRLGEAVVAFALAVNAGPTAAPLAFDLDQAVRRLAPRDRLAAGAEHGVQGFAAVNAVPVKIGMRLFELGGAGGFAVGDLAEIARAGGLRRFAVAQARRAEHRAVVFFRRREQGDAIG